MFQGGQAEQTLSEDNYSWLVRIVLGEGLQKGIYTEDDKVAYIKAWSQPGALTGGLNYYRANRVGPPSPDGTAARGNFAIDPARLTVSVPTLVIWGETDTALLVQNLDGLGQFVPRLAIQRIPDGSHWVVHEKPAEVTRTSGHLSPSHNLGPSAGMVTHWAAAFTAKTVRLVGYREVAVFRASALAENPELEKGMERCAVIHSLSALQ